MVIMNVRDAWIWLPWIIQIDGYIYIYDNVHVWLWWMSKVYEYDFYEWYRYMDICIYLWCCIYVTENNESVVMGMDRHACM